MGQPVKPILSPLYRGRVLIPGELLGDQVREMEAYGTWALQHGLNIADELLDRDTPLEARTLQGKLMGEWFSVAGASLGAINGRVNAFKFLQEVAHGHHPGGDAEQYDRAAARRRTR